MTTTTQDRPSGEKYLCPRCGRWHRADEAHPKPMTRADYLRWLDAAWNGDARELREGRYLHQQGDLERTFSRSTYWEQVGEQLDVWAREYRSDKNFALFQGSPRQPPIFLKTWSSFLNRNWRHNVRNNPNWPDPPEGGWVFPDRWFEQSWDIIRTRFVVRYLDGVEHLARRLEKCAIDNGLEPRRIEHAQEWGYYAMHVQVPQAFKVQTLTFEGEDARSSNVEIQITTELQEVVTNLTHKYFEQRRKADPDADIASQWQWRYSEEEFVPNYLGHMIHALEGMIMQRRTAEPPDDNW